MAKPGKLLYDFGASARRSTSFNRRHFTVLIAAARRQRIFPDAREFTSRILIWSGWVWDRQRSDEISASMAAARFSGGMRSGRMVESRHRI
jgi:hypothetical protein